MNQNPPWWVPIYLAIFENRKIFKNFRITSKFFVPEKKIVSLKKTVKVFFVTGTHRGGFQFIVILTP